MSPLANHLLAVDCAARVLLARLGPGSAQARLRLAVIGLRQAVARLRLTTLPPAADPLQAVRDTIHLALAAGADWQAIVAVVNKTGTGVE